MHLYRVYQHFTRFPILIYDFEAGCYSCHVVIYILVDDVKSYKLSRQFVNLASAM
jgi:hypothetical protein